MKIQSLVFALACCVSASASALSVAERESHSGVITAVDAATGSVVVRDGAGVEREIKLSEATRLQLNERAISDYSRLEAGQQIQFTLKTLNPLTEALEGVVLKVDHKRKVALIKPVTGGDAVEVQFEGSVKVSGIEEVTSLKDLRRGHIVTVRQI